ncbi:urease accessory protein [Tardiphaga sp. OK246]|jgi:urease accessory protein|nr:urease accessory protein [Tardiphaga sp. OK246]
MPLRMSRQVMDIMIMLITIMDTVTTIMGTTTMATAMTRTVMPVMAMTSMSMTSIAVTITIIIMITTASTTTTVILMLMTTNKAADDSPPNDSPALSADEGAALYRLMTWLSPAFPVGAFSYSSGIEWAVEAGDITDAASLQDWLSAMLSDGAGFCDGVFLAHVHRAASDGDDKALREVAELASAFVPSRERQLETTTQGKAFIEIARNAWSHEGMERLIAICDSPIVYPVAVGLVSAAHGVPLSATMHGFFHAVVSNWISAGARLVPLGQTDSQRVLAALEPVVVTTGHRAMAASLDDLGGATFRSDIASMRHETQYTRLFRS